MMPGPGQKAPGAGVGGQPQLSQSGGGQGAGAKLVPHISSQLIWRGDFITAKEARALRAPAQAAGCCAGAPVRVWGRFSTDVCAHWSNQYSLIGQTIR
jgi:hypothetical protein